MDARDAVLQACVKKLRELGLTDAKYTERLTREIKEIDAQMEHDYLYEFFKKKAKFAKNENNMFVAYLLGLADDFNIEEDANFVEGEFPDIDVDYLAICRDYLKNVWAIKYFGKENVCAIGNYTTFGIKSSLIDMAKTHGKSRSEILDLTTKIGLKDDDGKVFTWDKALEQYADLAAYCKANPDVADAASRLLNRNRGMGMHAGGLIISNQRIDNLVPLVKGKDGQYVSAFVEGLHGTDLGPLGLIKFDLLVITNLMQIAKCCKIIKERHGLKSICALPGRKDWSDTAYLNDPKALALAAEGKLKCIFQFDSEGIRELVRRGGVTSFDDLVAYSALYRPGPLGMKMDERYIERKRGREQYTIHPVLLPILGNTYGVMCYQEQVMKILRAVGLVPDMHCEIVRKAISKKKVEIFGRYKEMFLLNGQKILGWTKEQVSELWDQIASFAEYGFNKSHAVAYAYISARLLWLKAHYPLEFFTATLSETSQEKIKEYKTEAESMGIKLNRVDLNRSKEKFDICDGEIYMGFSNIKGVGDEVATEIVKGQPYADFEDFLRRFGTEAKVLKPLIALGVFCKKEEREKYYHYYEYFKEANKKGVDRNVRFKKSHDKSLEQLRAAVLFGERSDFEELNCEMSARFRAMIPDLQEDMFEETDRFFKACLTMSQNSFYHTVGGQIDGIDLVKAWELVCEYRQINHLVADDALHVAIHVAEDSFGKYAFDEWGITDEEALDQTWAVIKKYKRSLDGNKKKNEEDNIETLEEFYPVDNLDSEVRTLLSEVVQMAETQFYGFSWDHLLETSPDYQGGRTFSDFDEDETAFVRMCEVHIVEKPREKQSAKGTSYFIVKVEDTNSRSHMVTFWQDDYDRFKEELNFWEGEVRKGNFVRIRLKKPDPPFKNYTFDAPVRQLRWKELPKNKADDHRLQVMLRPTIVKMEEPRPIVNSGAVLIDLKREILEF